MSWKNSAVVLGLALLFTGSCFAAAVFREPVASGESLIGSLQIKTGGNYAVDGQAVGWDISPDGHVFNSLYTITGFYPPGTGRVLFSMHLNCAEDNSCLSEKPNLVLAALDPSS